MSDREPTSLTEQSGRNLEWTNHALQLIWNVVGEIFQNAERPPLGDNDMKIHEEPPSLRIELLQQLAMEFRLEIARKLAETFFEHGYEGELRITMVPRSAEHMGRTPYILPIRLSSTPTGDGEPMSDPLLDIDELTEGPFTLVATKEAA